MMYEELVESLRAPCPHENCVLCQNAADAIEELSKRIDKAVDIYNRNVKKTAMYEVLVGIAPEPPKEEQK